jgi:hypothetical protein
MQPGKSLSYLSATAIAISCMSLGVTAGLMVNSPPVHSLSALNTAPCTNSERANDSRRSSPGWIVIEATEEERQAGLANLANKKATP